MDFSTDLDFQNPGQPNDSQSTDGTYNGSSSEGTLNSLGQMVEDDTHVQVNNNDSRDRALNWLLGVTGDEPAPFLPLDPSNGMESNEWNGGIKYSTVEFKMLNCLGSPIICCQNAEIKNQYPKDIDTPYFNELHGFTLSLQGKVPTAIIPISDKNGSDVYATNNYIFTTQHYEGSPLPINRTFVCNSLSGNDVAELEISENCHLQSCFEEDVVKIDDGTELLVCLGRLSFRCTIHQNYNPVRIARFEYRPGSKELQGVTQGEI